MSLSKDQQASKDAYIALHGYWDSAWETILRYDPSFMKAYTELSAVPWRKNHLDSKTKELMYIAVDAAATHLYMPGVRHHIAAALRFGATAQEITEVLALTSTLGIHAMNIGVPILVEVLEEKGLRTRPSELTPDQERIKEDFTTTRGYWHEFWNEMLELDPEMFAAYTEFSSVPWREGTLEPKVREFVYIAFDASATHLYVKGLKLHIENAIGLGATPQEIIEVMEISSMLGMQATVAAAPILAEELAKFDANKATS